MNNDASYIIISGAAGFIGSCVAAALNEAGYRALVLSDDFSAEPKKANYIHKQYAHLVERSRLLEFLEKEQLPVAFFLHIGARTDTTETNWAVFEQLNVSYSKAVWHYCTRHRIPLIYASSAATYGDGAQGFDDDETRIPALRPLNIYGESKQIFDLWCLQQNEKPPFWAGLKFFNVFGPNEYHKGRMASVIFHAFRQIQAQGSMQLFRSHRPDFADGGQLRDFIYIKDLIAIILFLMQNTQRVPSGIYNAGTGQARSFLDLARAVFAAMKLPEHIIFIDTPADIRDKYQYFTEANMRKLRAAGFTPPFHSLENAVQDYVQNYLLPQDYM